MPVKIREGLPAETILRSENVFVMTEHRAATQDIRPLSLLVLNLMPTKKTTETQLLRVLGNSPLQVEVTFLRTASYESRHDAAHLEVFYETFDAVSANKYDGLIITGAPIEHLRFEDVAYWDELVKIMNWADANVFSTLAICWAAQAELYYHYGITKHPADRKVFGVFSHQVTDPKNKLTRGFDDWFPAPHSRHTTVDLADVMAEPDLEVLASSPDAGFYLAASRDGRRVMVTGHPEYDGNTLDAEYRRDLAAGLPISIPSNYYEGDDPARSPMVTWRAHGQLLYSNWLNYCVYQETPYDLHQLTAREQRADAAGLKVVHTSDQQSGFATCDYTSRPQEH